MLHDLLAALGDAAALIQEVSVRQRQRVDVIGVERRCDIIGGVRPAVEWYVDAHAGHRRSAIMAPPRLLGCR